MHCTHRRHPSDILSTVADRAKTSFIIIPRPRYTNTYYIYIYTCTSTVHTGSRSDQINNVDSGDDDSRFDSGERFTNNSCSNGNCEQKEAKKK